MAERNAVIKLIQLDSNITSFILNTEKIGLGMNEVANFIVKEVNVVDAIAEYLNYYNEDWIMERLDHLQGEGCNAEVILKTLEENVDIEKKKTAFN